jgi:uncharacterized membrane protein YkvA (DUF1232 family)
VSPVDLIPDFVPIIGSIDDIIVMAMVLRWAGRRVGQAALDCQPVAESDRK